MSNEKPQTETPYALEAKARYLTMPRPRSLARLAEELYAERQAQYVEWAENRRRAEEALGKGVRGEYAVQAHAALQKPAPKVGSLKSIERRLKDWSSAHGWQKYCEEEDAKRVNEEQRKRQAAVSQMNDQQATIAQALTVQSVRRIQDLLKADEEALRDYDAELARCRLLVDRLLREGKVAEAAKVEFPRRPKPYIGGYTLVQLASLGMETHRLAVESSSALVEEAGEAALPEVVEAYLTSAPPPLPTDPHEGMGGTGGDGDGLPPEVARSVQAALLGAHDGLPAPSEVQALPSAASLPSPSGRPGLPAPPSEEDDLDLPL